MRCKPSSSAITPTQANLLSNGMGTTIFLALDTPKSGGDTLYLSTVAAYNSLSPLYREKLHGLEATHSGFDQALVADHKERYIRRPIETIHPVVRTHPVSAIHQAAIKTTDGLFTGDQVQVVVCQSAIHEAYPGFEGRRKRYAITARPFHYVQRLTY